MSLSVFQPLCVCVLAAALLAMSMTTARVKPGFWAGYAVLAVAAFIGEDSSIRLYRFYAYAPGWWLRVDQVPLLVPLIWPLVILSADEVGRALGISRRWAPLWALGCVVIDASLVEVVAVRAGYWTWVEPGHLGVPIIGILGWGFFAAGAIWGRRYLLLPLVAGPLAVHAGIQLAWWGLFRYTLRGPLEPGSVIAVAVIGLGLSIAAARYFGRVSLAVAGPRMLAASLFVAVLFGLPPSVPLGMHLAAVAVPYLLITSFRVKTRSPAGRA